MIGGADDTRVRRASMSELTEGGGTMEVHPGVFVSSVSPRDWEPDAEVPGSDVHVLVDSDGVSAGLTRFTTVDGPVLWTPPQREVIHVLEGAVRIEIERGPALQLVPGDTVSLPAGVPTTWHITAPFKETLGPGLMPRQTWGRVRLICQG
jgi:uncharacterized cupin superfamily protein